MISNVDPPHARELKKRYEKRKKLLYKLNMDKYENTKSD